MASVLAASALADATAPVALAAESEKTPAEEKVSDSRLREPAYFVGEALQAVPAADAGETKEEEEAALAAAEPKVESDTAQAAPVVAVSAPMATSEAQAACNGDVRANVEQAATAADATSGKLEDNAATEKAKSSAADSADGVPERQPEPERASEQKEEEGEDEDDDEEEEEETETEEDDRDVEEEETAAAGPWAASGKRPTWTGGAGGGWGGARGVEDAGDPFSERHVAWAPEDEEAWHAAAERDYYAALELPRELRITASRVRAAYHRLAVKWHPRNAWRGGPTARSFPSCPPSSGAADGGESEAKEKERAWQRKALSRFWAIKEAYLTLKDPERKRIYDECGLTGLRQSESYAAESLFDFDAFDVYDRFFSGEDPEDRDFLLMNGGRPAEWSDDESEASGAEEEADPILAEAAKAVASAASMDGSQPSVNGSAGGSGGATSSSGGRAIGARTAAPSAARPPEPELPKELRLAMAMGGATAGGPAAAAAAREPAWAELIGAALRRVPPKISAAAEADADGDAAATSSTRAGGCDQAVGVAAAAPGQLASQKKSDSARNGRRSLRGRLWRGATALPAAKRQRLSSAGGCQAASGARAEAPEEQSAQNIEV
eukprot:TRINITY_DN11015_c0_g4_i1.p1 TRINITY_DN11015_c0_g4~~TRINITY_DN11015_c0_g4_i1.p1  ORF type:complete len:611 (-),score=206.25 TRINITY_DN11015_c0_g4_i1:287-2119(-)